MKRLLWSMFLVLVMMLFSGVVLASDISDALWTGNIVISNNGTATTSVSANISSLNSTSLIDNDFAGANLSDTAIQINGVDTAFMPGYGNNPWIVYVPTIGVSQSLNYDLYTGNVTDGKIRIFLDDRMTTSDAAGLECGDYFSITVSGLTPPGDAGNMLSKPNAFGIYRDGSSNITAAIMNSTPTWQTPASVNGTGWNNTSNAIDDNAGTYAETTTTVNYQAWSPFLQFNYSSVIRVSQFRYWYDAATNDTGTQIDIDCWNGTEWIGIYSGVTGGEGAYRTQNVVSANASMIRCRLYNGWSSGSQDLRFNEVDFGEEAVDLSITATGVTGDAEVTALADSSYLRIYVDDVESDNVSLGGNSVPDNASDWLTGLDMPYVEYQEISVGGVQKQYVDWEYATTFTDSSGNSNDATPTLRTTSSNANVSANLTSLQPVDEAKVATFTLSDTYSILTANATFPTEMYSELDTSKIPGGEAVDELLATGEVPQAAWWYPFLFLGICIIGLITYGGTTLTRSKNGLSEGQIDGSLLTMFIVMEVLLVIISFMGPIPFWPAILFPIPGIAIILSRKHFSWG